MPSVDLGCTFSEKNDIEGVGKCGQGNASMMSMPWSILLNNVNRNVGLHSFSDQISSAVT
jgi:hypothetical protein